MDATIPLQEDARTTVSLSWKGGTRDVPLTTERLTVGRDPACDVAIEDPSLSRRHAVIVRRESGVWVEDLGSSNGTWSAGERVCETLLRPGRSVRLGSVLLVLRSLDGEGDALAMQRIGFLDAWKDWLPRRKARRRFEVEVAREKAGEERALLALVEGVLQHTADGVTAFDSLLEPLRALDLEILALTASRDDAIADQRDRRGELASERASREAPLRLFEEERHRAESHLQAIERERHDLAERRRQLGSRAWSSAGEDLELRQVEERASELGRRADEVRSSLRHLEEGVARARTSYEESQREERRFDSESQSQIRTFEAERAELQRTRLTQALTIGRELALRDDLPSMVNDLKADVSRRRLTRRSSTEARDAEIAWLRSSSQVRVKTAGVALVVLLSSLGLAAALTSRTVTIVEASAQPAETLATEPVRRATGMLVLMLEHTPSGGSKRYAYAGMGSCFAIDRPGMLVTNRHNLEGADELRKLVAGETNMRVRMHAIFGPDECYPVVEAYRAKDADLAVVRLQGEHWKEGRPNWPHLAVGHVDEVGPNTPVWAVGFPAAAWEASQRRGEKVRFERSVIACFDEAALAHKFTTGIVSCEPFRVDNGTTSGRVILSGATINPGNSGGPLVDARGRVLGVNTYLVEDSAGMNHAIVLEDLLDDALRVVDALANGGSER